MRLIRKSSVRNISPTALLLHLILITGTLLPFHAIFLDEEPSLQNEPPRSLQQSQTCTNTPQLSSTSSPQTINQVLTYLDSHRSILESRIFQSYTNPYRNKTKLSENYRYDDFRSMLEYMAKTGIPNPTTPNQPYKLYLGPDNCHQNGWQIGLVNIAAFLSQAMTLSIRNDTCDEINWESVSDDSIAPIYPLSNACGMRGWEYTSHFHSCQEYDCPIQKNMKVKAVDKAKGNRVPPKLECYRRTEGRRYTGYFDPTRGVLEDRIVESFAGRTDVEGCCWWGRGPLQTKGTCQIGKINHFLGKKAADDGRKGAMYKNIDFCQNPEAICSDKQTMEIRWAVAFFEWMERVQSYNEDGWEYVEQLHKAMEGDLLNDLKFARNTFIDEVGGILEQGCPNPPCDTVERMHRLNWANERKLNFRVALESFGLPIKSEAFREIETLLLKGKAAFEEVVLRSVNPIDKTTYQSYRYQFSDFLEALRLMSDIGYDNKFFYIGQQSNGDFDAVEGLTNIALFLSQAAVQSIQDDACDEDNVQLVSGKYPVSNSCGQFGRSYQDITCTGANIDMTCPLDPNQSFSGVTRPLWFRSPQPFKCAPKSQYPVTGYWDERHVEEIHQTAYANELGRTDIESCCWWGRGVFRNVTQGRCFFGQMNYYIGKRAASEGRASLYPTVDFCQFPEAICASEFSHQLRWVAGMFYWIQEVQSYDKRGWNYMEQLRGMSLNTTLNGDIDGAFVIQLDCILKTGNVNCDVGDNSIDLLVEIMSTVMTFNLPTMSPTVTQPTDPPVPLPTTSPVIPPSPFPTTSALPTSSPVIFDIPTKGTIEYIIDYLEERESVIKEKILRPLSGEESIYTFEAFIDTLELLSKGIKDGKYFYVGGAAQTRKRGLVNIAAFLAHVRTLSIEKNVCDESNTDFTDSTHYPLSNACGQYGMSYQDMRCEKHEAFMECRPNPLMQMAAVPRENAEAQPPPFFCGPKKYFPFTGFYDSTDGSIKTHAPLGNAIGRKNVEGCCWWGRGAARVTGVCLYGKLNYYLKDKFPDVDFCENPGAICSGSFSFTLMWVTGMFVWLEYMQSDVEYSNSLDRYAGRDVTDNKETAETELVDIISERLDQGRNKEHRLTNFQLVLTALGID